MTTINLNPIQAQVVLSAINGSMEDYFNEIRQLDDEAEDYKEAFDSMMDCYEHLAGVKALIEAQALPARVKKDQVAATYNHASDALRALSAAVEHGNEGRKAIKKVLSQFGAATLADVQPANYEKVVAACAEFATH